MAFNRTFIRCLSSSALLALSAVALFAQAGMEDIKLTVGKSIVVDYPSDVARISTSNPEVVDYVAVTTREILLQAKATGFSTLVVWGKTGQRTFYNITVEQNLEPLRRLLRETFPREEVQVQSARDAITLTGRVSAPYVLDRIVAIATPFAKAVVNNLTVAPGAVERQVMLRVKFAELGRTAQTALGASLVSTGAGNTLARITTGQFAAPTLSGFGGAVGVAASSFNLNDSLNVFAFRPDINLGVVIRALQTQGILQILAEPNIVTSSDKDASFLVGGEFPIPVIQGGGNAGSVTVQFREYGIRLNFRPSITENKTIKIYVRPEVSTIDVANGVSVSGFAIPALATRRIESNVELGEGQSFVIGGLIDDRVQESFSKIPGLASIPVLGYLFKSKEDRRSKTELVVIVTPEIVTPLQATDPKPMPAFPREFMAPAMPAPGTQKTSLPTSNGGKRRK